MLVGVRSSFLTIITYPKSRSTQATKTAYPARAIGYKSARICGERTKVPICLSRVTISSSA